jgi:hypothetical protein
MKNGGKGYDKFIGKEINYDNSIISISWNGNPFRLG